MKKFVFLIMCFVILVSIISCSHDKIKEASETLEEESNENYKVINEKALYDDKYKWIKAFIDKDPKACSELMNILPDEYKSERENLYEKWYEPIKTLEFGNFSVNDKEDYVDFAFEVKESNYDIFPIGTYKYKVYDSAVAKVGWENVSDEDLDKEFDDIYNLISVVSSHKCFSFNDDNDQALDKVSATDAAIFYALNFCESKWSYNKNTGVTLDELKEGAKEMFGIENYTPSPNDVEYKDGRYFPKTFGGVGISVDFLKTKEEGDSYICYAQFYADPMKMAKSYLVKYTLRKNNTKYRYKFEKIEIEDEGIYSPFIWVI